MREFVNSLKRLLKSGKITQDKITSLFNEGKITLEEKDFIFAD